MGFTYYGISNKKGSKRPTVDGLLKSIKVPTYLSSESRRAVVDGIYYDSGYYEKSKGEKHESIKFR